MSIKKKEEIVNDITKSVTLRLGLSKDVEGPLLIVLPDSLFKDGYEALKKVLPEKDFLIMEKMRAAKDIDYSDSLRIAEMYMEKAFLILSETELKEYTEEFPATSEKLLSKSGIASFVLSEEDSSIESDQNQKNEEIINKIIEMAKMQGALNDATNGKGWENGYTQNGKPINWLRAARLEAEEMIDQSFPWPHWKKLEQKIDMDNVKIETVDVWHFVLSHVLVKTYENGHFDNITFKKVTDILVSLPNWAYATGEKKYDAEADMWKTIDDIEPFIILTMIKDRDKRNPLRYRAELLDGFFKLLGISGMSFDELYSLYVGKNTLNIFRQKHNYKGYSEDESGNPLKPYIKMWNGEEDNVVMQRIVNENPGISFDELYRKLEEAYPGNSR